MPMSLSGVLMNGRVTFKAGRYGFIASIVNPGASYNAEEGIATVRNQMFDLMVKKPYMLMQYGTTEVDEGSIK